MPPTIEVRGFGAIPVVLDGAYADVMTTCFAAGTRGRIHRAEPLPPAGSIGPPYGLVQMTLQDDSLKALSPGGVKLTRGALCLIGGASDLFISLARNGEHDGWEGGMTVIGHVLEPELTTIVEGQILALPKHNNTHPHYGVVMSMLDTEIPCQLKP